MAIFSSRLKSERKRLHIKSKDFAERTGVHATRQSAYENNGFPEFGDYLAKAAEMGVDLNYVFTGERGGVHLTAEESEFLALMRGAAPEVRATALDVLRTGTVITKSVHVGRDNFGEIKL